MKYLAVTRVALLAFALLTVPVPAKAQRAVGSMPDTSQERSEVPPPPVPPRQPEPGKPERADEPPSGVLARSPSTERRSSGVPNENSPGRDPAAIIDWLLDQRLRHQ